MASSKLSIFAAPRPIKSASMNSGKFPSKLTCRMTETALHCRAVNFAPNANPGGATAGFPKTNQSKRTTCKQMRRFCQRLSCSEARGLRNTSGYGTGIGHVEAEAVDVASLSGTDGLRSMLSKKPRRPQGVLSSHLGIEFRKAGTRKVDTLDPGTVADLGNAGSGAPTCPPLSLKLLCAVPLPLGFDGDGLWPSSLEQPSPLHSAPPPFSALLSEASCASPSTPLCP